MKAGEISHSQNGKRERVQNSTVSYLFEVPDELVLVVEEVEEDGQRRLPELDVRDRRHLKQRSDYPCEKIGQKLQITFTDFDMKIVFLLIVSASF